MDAPTHWVVEGLIEPGVRGWITLCKASSAEDAIRVAREYHGENYSRLCAYPSYVATGECMPVTWESALHAAKK